MDAVTPFYIAMLVPPAVVLAVAVLPSTASRNARLDIEGFLILATAPHNIALVIATSVPHRAFSVLGIPMWLLHSFWLAYMSIALVLSLRFTFLRWHAGGWLKKCELTFSLFFFGAHWLLYAFVVFVGIPPL
jgi:hypothetical protein